MSRYSPRASVQETVQFFSARDPLKPRTSNRGQRILNLSTSQGFSQLDPIGPDVQRVLSYCYAGVQRFLFRSRGFPPGLSQRHLQCQTDQSSCRNMGRGDSK
jgi:hypothetical protein